MRRLTGVSLIELMLVVAILGLLLAVALPSYRGQLASGYRSEALVGLMRLANLQERYYLGHQSYTDDMAKLGMAADPWVTESGRYALDAEAADDAGYLLKATAIGAQALADADCVAITLSDSGVRSPKECWQ